MGVSPLHSSTVGIIRNLNTNRMSPQVHVVYDNLFQTVHSDEFEPPAKWLYLIVFDSFRSNFDCSNFVPELAYEWMTPVDLARRREAKHYHWNQASYQDKSTPQRAPYDLSNQRAPPQDGTAPQKAPYDERAQDGTTDPQSVPPQVKDIQFLNALQDEPPVLTSPPWIITRHSDRLIVLNTIT